MINYEEFCKYMMNDLQNYFVEQEKDCEVLLYHATKTNNVSRLGLTIKSAGSNISPTIYMEEFYEKLIDGSSIGDIRDELVNLYEYTVEKSPNIDFMDDFKLENIKDKIAMRMVNYKDNREMLSETPHKKVDDLAVYYVVVVGCNRDGTACMTIRNTHQEMLGITTDELHQIAMDNTSKIFPPVLMRIEDKFSNIKDNLFISEDVSTKSEMYVLTNEIVNFGAVNILSSDITEKVRKIIGGDYYIIPSSVHELLLVSKNEMVDARGLGILVREVNGHMVDREDRLSDHIYEMDFEKNELRTVKESLPRYREMER